MMSVRTATKPASTCVLESGARSQPSMAVKRTANSASPVSIVFTAADMNLPSYIQSAEARPEGSRIRSRQIRERLPVMPVRTAKVRPRILICVTRLDPANIIEAGRYRRIGGTGRLNRAQAKRPSAPGAPAPRPTASTVSRSCASLCEQLRKKRRRAAFSSTAG